MTNLKKLNAADLDQIFCTIEQISPAVVGTYTSDIAEHIQALETELMEAKYVINVSMDSHNITAKQRDTALAQVKDADIVIRLVQLALRGDLDQVEVERALVDYSNKWRNP